MGVTETITSVWNGYDDETRRQELSHWRGIGKWADDRKWQSVGKRSVQRLQQLRRHTRNKGRLQDLQLNMLEWGPGGGSNAFAFRDVAQAYYGIDISEKNLGETARVMTEEGRGDVFRPVHLQDDPATISAHVTEPLDAFLSTAVFQHFPSKEYGADVLKAIRSVCREGALGLIQTRYDNGDHNFRPNSSVEQYEKRFIKATSYRIDEFWALCEDNGFEVLYLGELNAKSHYATYAMMAV
jgi:hypothetical protein